MSEKEKKKKKSHNPAISIFENKPEMIAKKENYRENQHETAKLMKWNDINGYPNESMKWKLMTSSNRKPKQSAANDININTKPEESMALISIQSQIEVNEIFIWKAIK